MYVLLRPIPVDVMDPNEATALLRQGGRGDDADAVALALELGHLPLALAQAAAYIEQNSFATFKSYLELFQSQATRFVNTNFLPSYSRSIFLFDLLGLIHCAEMIAGLLSARL